MISQLRLYIHDFPIVAIGGINETNVQPIVDEEVQMVFLSSQLLHVVPI